MSRRPRTVAAIIVVVLVAAGVVGYGGLGPASASVAVLSPRTTVGGVDVSGLDRDQALAAVRRVVDADADRVATLRVGSRAYATSLRALGAGNDAEAAVDQAFLRSTAASWHTRVWARLTHRSPRPLSIAVQRSTPAAERVRAIVARAVQEAAREPVSARVGVRGGWLTFTRAVPGSRLDPAAATAALAASLGDGRVRAVVPAAVPPKVGDAAYSTVVLVRTGENRLYLYVGGRILRSFPVATGSPDFPTPSGRFHIEHKRYLPTWVNPHPDEGWGKLEPPTIPPGPDNPLGTRAMNLDVPNIRIHGTPAAASVGYSASHGCIRMRIPDVEALYPLVPTGTTVFVTAAGPPRMPPPNLKVSVASLAEGG